jgi:PilZ domain-containing protein
LPTDLRHHPQMPDLTLVIPVLVSSERRVVQTTSGTLSPEEIWVRCVAPPRLRSRASMALQLPDGELSEVVVGDVVETTRDDPKARNPGFRARFVDLTPTAQRRIATALQRATEQHRSFPRMAAKLTVMAGATVFRSRNISAVGMFVEHLGGAVPGDSLEVRLDFGDNGPAPAKALVIHSLDDGAGLQFVDSSRDFRLRLDRYVASLAARS